MDRLLSEQEIIDCLPTGFDPEPCELAICAAQLAKTDKEWVEWLESVLFREADGWLVFRELPKFALTDWENRKKELGL